MQISVVIAALNEALALPPTLAALHAQHGFQPAEVILVDGGSTDATVAVARQAGAHVLTGARGRARQMNLGAATASGQVLLFLHADTLLPPDALAQVQTAMAAGAVWGRFDVQIQGQAAMLKVVAWCMNQRSRLSGIATGDQALFVSRAALDAVGGFPDQPLMEDIEISNRLKHLGRPACVRSTVITSGRRWESRGVWRTIVLMWWLRLAYWRGVSPERLAALYR